MSPQVSTVQKRGQVTIPANLRRKLGIAPGDQVMFVPTDEGILITTPEEQNRARLAQLLTEIRAIIQEEGEKRGRPLSLEELIASGRDIRGEIARDKYGLGVSEE